MARRQLSTVNATYVYCVVASPSRPPLGGVPAGIPGAARPEPVLLTGKLWFIAAGVPIAMYGEHAVNAGLRDLEWVSAIAVGHEAVVEYFTRRRGSTVIPMKLLTIFSSVESAREELLREREDIRRAVRRIAGCEEWGIRVFAEPGVQSVAVRRAGTSAPLTGSAFLASRKAVRDAQHDFRLRTAAAAEEAYESLAAITRAARQRPERRDEGATPPLLDAAFLVPSSSRARFKAAARKEAARCAAAGARMTLTGPWPAYNFIGNDGEKT
jgi:Gas vesicle synthesis protein GvpL/GvpF